jgi:hypothetical protein
MLDRRHWNAHNAGRQNPFLRLVRRHANLATILRAIDSHPIEDSFQLMPNLDGDLSDRQETPFSQVVKAFLVTNPEQLPELKTDSPLAEIPTSPATSTPAVQRAPASRPDRLAGPAPIQTTQPSPTSQSPTAPDESENRPQAINERTWSRLETIFRMHQEKEAAETAANTEEMPDEGQESPEVIPDKARTEPTSTIPPLATPMLPPENSFTDEETGSTTGQIQATASMSPTTSASLQKANEVPTPPGQEAALPEIESQPHFLGQTADSIEKIQVQISVEPQPEREDLPRESVKAVAAAPHLENGLPTPPSQPIPTQKSQITPEAVSPPTKSQADSGSAIPVLPPSKAGQVENLTPINEQPSQALQSLPSSQSIRPEPETQEISTTASENQAPLSGYPLQAEPLQAAWPVQRLESPVPPFSIPQSDQAPLREEAGPEALTEPTVVSSHREEIAPLSVTPESQLQDVLDQVRPGQVSDSSIELIPPRKPRPRSRKPSPPVASPAMNESIDSQSGFTSTADETIPSNHPTTSSIQRQLADNRSKVAQAGINKVSKDDSSAPGITPEELVPTEIGPLPGDLWRLLGQSPPKTKPTPSSAAAPSAEITVMEQQSALEPSHSDSLPYVQRQADQAGPAPAQTTTGQESDAAQGPDINELARKVYTEIKRKLALEWERIRHP